GSGLPFPAGRLAVLGRVGVGEGPRDALPAAVAHLALAAVGLPGAPVGAFAAVDDDGHVRVVLVVLDHLVEELGLELARDHAVDHPALSVGRTAAGARCERCPGPGARRPPRARSTTGSARRAPRARAHAPRGARAAPSPV